MMKTEESTSHSYYENEYWKNNSSNQKQSYVAVFGGVASGHDLMVQYKANHLHAFSRQLK